MRLPGGGRPPPLLLPFLLLLGPARPFRLNVPKVLLPFSREVHVPFVLQAEGGCYSCSSVFQVFPACTSPLSPLREWYHCSQKALLSTAVYHRPQNTFIYSHILVTGHLLRCDIIVDMINSIEIISRTREIYVEDSPLELTVRALDVEGNTFSSLSGMTFEWSIAKDDDMEGLELSSKIRILKYCEAEYSPPDYIVEMEQAGKQGDRTLVSGIKTGAAIIKVRIQEPTYKKVAAALVRLLVLENIFLIPSYDIYLLVGAYIQYQVAKIVQGKITGQYTSLGLIGLSK
uniref:Uncharacterized protein n=1 Tax=Chelonoidis abingdonii TaxID=106734 RepID=A0A8C0G9P2_CHEAB